MDFTFCSACLLGFDCKYNGKSNIHKCPQTIIDLYNQGKLIPICPEQMGGLPTPRTGSRIVSGSGYDVLDGTSKVVSEDGKDISSQFVKGAYEVLKMAKAMKIKNAILKDESPSCGVYNTQGGAEKREDVKGTGVTAALLIRNRISVKTEKDF